VSFLRKSGRDHGDLVWEDTGYDTTRSEKIFVCEETDAEDGTNDEGGEDRRGRPRVGCSAPLDSEDDEADAQDEENHARPVDDAEATDVAETSRLSWGSSCPSAYEFFAHE
jgi:hypothetical protein